MLSVAVSVDGYLDDAGPERLLLSNPDDFDRVDAVRADSDAILAGAETLRRDDPRLLVRSDSRRARRVSAGKPEHPVKVTVTAGGDLDPRLRFFHSGGDKLVYTTDVGAARIGDRLDTLAEVVSLGGTPDFGALLDDLGRRGVTRLMVEGGGHVHTAFLAGDLADELLLAVAPVLIGDSRAPHFLHPADFPGGSRRRMVLADVDRIGDVALLRYLPRQAEPPTDGRSHDMETPQ